ncbi:hypothetical protein ES332_A01G046400v1 [Gossypium tomentosum]|uniref:Fe2OG dioxygenase domain-containing protein n=1 Tax=Gossypium tomentosum TaxID=34277 RepID=A0A5D2RLM0_GOSTO|nr:hypothetical protein ES332_A01G046400v1 [Gossypium tomentosum]
MEEGAPSFDNATSLFNFVVRDGNGIKGMVDSGISKPYIQPPTERINKKNAGVCKIPPIDLSKLDGPQHDEVANQIVRAAETLGFFQVINHGVPVELLESLKQTAHNFFALHPERKAVYRKEVSPSPLVKYGTSFVPEKEKAFEWKDYISMAYTNDDEALQQDVALQYLKTSHEMVRKLLEALLGNLGVELDDSKIDAFIGKKMVSMNFYPTCPNPELTVGVGRHSDMGTLTILLQDGIGGLYVKVPEDVDMEKKGAWVEIPPIPGALVINVGDMLQIWSNGKYKSAEHRVRTTSTKSRVSIPIFTCPQSTQKIAPLPQVVKKDGIARYKEFIFSDYMNSFFGNAHDGKNSLEFAKINSA